MRITVVGPGAMGCLFAARLAEAGEKVVLLDHRAERARELSEKGIVVEDGRGTGRVRVPVVTTFPAHTELCILLAKSYSCDSIEVPPNTPVLCLQNGLGVVEILCEKAGSAYVLVGATTEAATMLAPGHSRHVAKGVTTIGSWTSCPAEPVAAALRKAGFEVVLTDSPGQMIWEKAAMNAGINPLTALLDVPNGELLRIPEARQLMRDLVVEAAKVAATEGYRFDYSLVERAEAVCSATADNISSMLQDVRNRKCTEIDAISGEILRRAQAASLPTPRTRVVYQLVKSLEQR